MCLASQDMGETGISLLNAMRLCADTMRQYGTVFNTDECINLARQLGILKQTNGNIDFVLEEYRAYFFMRALENDL